MDHSTFTHFGQSVLQVQFESAENDLCYGISYLKYLYLKEKEMAWALS